MNFILKEGIIRITADNFLNNTSTVNEDNVKNAFNKIQNT